MFRAGQCLLDQDETEYAVKIKLIQKALQMGRR
jgi:hypothetical protein